LSKKKSSKTGSVLILRFFHGLIFQRDRIDNRASRAACQRDDQTRAPPRAKLFLQDPSALVFVHRAMAEQVRLYIKLRQVSQKFDSLIFESRMQLHR